eukprot:scaffold5674_cov129-Isochrysis_galbana.AAC.4
MVPGSAKTDGRPSPGTHPSHSRETTAASRRRKGGARGGWTPKTRRSSGKGSTFRSNGTMGARQPDVRSTELVHCGVSCSRVTNKTEPVPMVIASWAESRKVRMPSNGRASWALVATVKQERTIPTKITVIAAVPQPYSTTVAATRTPIEAHSHNTPSATPCRNAKTTVAFIGRRNASSATNQPLAQRW